MRVSSIPAGLLGASSKGLYNAYVECLKANTILCDPKRASFWHVAASVVSSYLADLQVAEKLVFVLARGEAAVSAVHRILTDFLLSAEEEASSARVVVRLGRQAVPPAQDADFSREVLRVSWSAPETWQLLLRALRTYSVELKAKSVVSLCVLSSRASLPPL